jgi:4-aminobutyrate aminotransferase-like enzyme
LREFAEFLPFPHDEPRGSSQWRARLEASLHQLARKGGYGAVLVEPIQARGGIRIPPAAFLPTLRRWCSELGMLLILDEIYTGFGRTGKDFACDHGRVVPDLLCVGKALAGGFPISACIGRSDLMDAAWPESQGEAIHTSTFLGHPVGCAMALQNLREIDRLRLSARAAEVGQHLLSGLIDLCRRLKGCLRVRLQARGLGLMAGLDLTTEGGVPATAESLGCVQALLEAGYILLPEGEHGNVIGFTPPLVVTQRQIDSLLTVLETTLLRVVGRRAPTRSARS